LGGELWSVSGVPGELSVVCEERRVPPGAEAKRGWSCLEVAGPLDFSEVGVLAALTAPLAEAGVSLFALSTWSTDYLLVSSDRLPAAVAALRAAGHTVTGASR
ncbi:MAG: ACT domain-containing protein, partial [Thermoanaerobaculia bacterium]|nr:ACT domain-containing protein [Thermoanaerobaculia bacterium]